MSKNHPDIFRLSLKENQSLFYSIFQILLYRSSFQREEPVPFILNEISLLSFTTRSLPEAVD